MTLAGEATDGASRRRIDVTSYRPDHSRLLAPLPDPPLRAGAPTTLGGIVVPTSRSLRKPLPGVLLAVELAEALECPLVVITSQNAHGEHLPEALRRRLGQRLVVIDLATVGSAWHPELRTPLHSLERLGRVRYDVGRKRNLGISIATAMARDAVLFIDDDVAARQHGPTLDADGLRHALGGLAAEPELQAVAWTLEDFPDNSVAGHVRRVVPGLEQEVFVGGGALLARICADTPFFPDIYNEDWLFLQALARTTEEFRTAVRHAGSVTQLRYYPFTETRAIAEEPGEVLAEGFMNLIEESRAGDWTETGHWQDCITRRARMMKILRSELLRAPGLQGTGPYLRGRDTPGTLREQARKSLAAAMQVNEDLKARDFVDYLQVWHEDLLDAWPNHLARLRRNGLDSMPEDALAKRLRQCHR